MMVTILYRSYTKYITILILDYLYNYNFFIVLFKTGERVAHRKRKVLRRRAGRGKKTL